MKFTIFLLLVMVSMSFSGTADSSVEISQVFSDSIFLQAKASYKQHNYAQCIDLLMQYREIAGVNYALEYYMGMSFFYLEHYKWAAIHLERARSLDQAHEDAVLYVLVQIYAVAGHAELSRDRYRELLKKYLFWNKNHLLT